MNLVRLIDFLRDRLKTVTKVSVFVLVGLVIIDAIPLVVDKEDAHTGAEKFPLFWAAFGFVACVLIIIASKAFGHAGIMKREDYYDE
jgi:hypothetical protein